MFFINVLITLATTFSNQVCTQKKGILTLFFKLILITKKYISKITKTYVRRKCSNEKVTIS